MLLLWMMKDLSIRFLLLQLLLSSMYVMLRLSSVSEMIGLLLHHAMAFGSTVRPQLLALDVLCLELGV